MDSSQTSPVRSLTPAGTGSARPRRAARAPHAATGDHGGHTPTLPTNAVTPTSCSLLIPPSDLDSQVCEDDFRASLVVQFHSILSSLLVLALAFAFLCVCCLAFLHVILAFAWLVASLCSCFVASLHVILGFLSFIASLCAHCIALLRLVLRFVPLVQVASLCSCCIASLNVIFGFLSLIASACARCIALLRSVLSFVSLVEGFSWLARDLVILAFSYACVTLRRLFLLSFYYYAVGLPMLCLVTLVVFVLEFSYVTLSLVFLLISLLRVSKGTMWRSAVNAHLNIFTETLENFFVCKDFDVTFDLFRKWCSEIQSLTQLRRESLPSLEDETEMAATAVSIDYNIRRDDFAKFHMDLHSSLPRVGAVRVDTADAMVDGHRKFHVELGSPSTSLVECVGGTLILPRQRKNMPPDGWIHVKLVGESWWLDRTTIAVREDNLYGVAFQNNAGRWFVLDGGEREFPAAAAIRASSLAFKGGYGDLVAGGHKKLTDLPLSRQAALDAVRVLARHRCYEDALMAMFERKKQRRSPEDSDLSEKCTEYYLWTAQSKFQGENYDKKLRAAMATILVLVAEAARFKSIHDTLVDGWRRQDAEVNISEREANMVVFWRSISLTSLRWAEFGELKWCRDLKRSRDIKFRGPEEAFGELNLVLWPKDFEFGPDRSSHMICRRPGRDRERHWG